jgi:NAD(P)-dependent dehydrogenase (short-subunit alcohol dehydrogenase family)
MAGLVEGKVVLVTGAGSGIGRAAALAFAREGGRVVASDRDRDAGEATASLAQEAAGVIRFMTADVTPAAEVEGLIGQVVNAFGRLDCAFNDAGVEGPGVPTHEHSEEDWDRVLATNLRGRPRILGDGHSATRAIDPVQRRDQEATHPGAAPAPPEPAACRDFLGIDLTSIVIEVTGPDPWTGPVR